VTDENEEKELSPVEAVLKFIIEGNKNSDILGYFEENGINDTAAGAAMQLAFDQLIAAGKVDPEIRLGWCIEAFREVYRLMLKTGDYSGALKAIHEVGKISGIYPDKRNVKDKGDGDEPPDAPKDVKCQIKKQMQSLRLQ